jgi:endoglucanase
LFVIYNLPHRDCGQHSAGGAPDAAAYRSWVLAFTAGIDQAKAFVVIEPDALAQLDCLSADQRAERLDLLRFATDTLAASPRAVSYLDAGHRDWIAPAEMARRLQDAGIREIRGFSVNGSFYDSTTAEITYGKTVSDLVDHKPFVIDTSRNGKDKTSAEWCNPAGHALGPAPLTAPGEDRVDALLWIKTPGVSDGDCGRGEPRAGVFWIERAIELATAADW